MSSSRCVADLPAGSILQRKRSKNPCVLCSAAAYCCGAVAPRAIAALLGRFLPRLGPLVHSSGPFFFWVLLRHSGMVRRTRPQMRNCASGNLEILRCAIAHRSSCFACSGTTILKVYSAAAWNGPRSPSGTCASASASAAKSVATRAKRGPRSLRRSSI